MKRIAIIGTVGLPPKYGGFETLANCLVINQKDKFDFTVYCSLMSYNQKQKIFEGARLIYIPFKANGIQSIIYDIISILHATYKNDILLILGISGCVILPFISLFNRQKKVIVNIDGLEWKRAKWNKFAKWYLKFSEKLAVKYSKNVIADNKEIQKYIKNEYGLDSHLIEYGGDLVRVFNNKEDHINKFKFLNYKYAFGVCRIEPENNVHMILEAFKKMNNFPIVIVGNWNNSRYGKALKLRYKNFKNIHLINAIYEQEKLDILRSNSYVYIHGHSAGGTNPSLVEAMFLRVPIIAYDTCYNRQTTEYKAIYFKNSNDLINILNSIEKYNLIEISLNMFEIAERRYKWATICGKYGELFEI